MRHIQKSQFLIYRLHNKICILKIQYSKTLFYNSFHRRRKQNEITITHKASAVIWGECKNSWCSSGIFPSILEKGPRMYTARVPKNGCHLGCSFPQ